ncbi:MAG: hypothetical protein R3C10_22720 [Pirellulales bacterium]
MLSSVGVAADRVLIDLWDDESFCRSDDGAALLRQLASVVGARRDDGEVGRLVDAVLTSPTYGAGDEGLRRDVLLALEEAALVSAGGRLAATATLSPTSVRALAEVHTARSGRRLMVRPARRNGSLRCACLPARTMTRPSERLAICSKATRRRRCSLRRFVGWRASTKRASAQGCSTAGLISLLPCVRP